MLLEVTRCCMVDSDISIYFIYLKLNTDTYLKLYHIIIIIIILLLLFFLQ